MSVSIAADLEAELSLIETRAQRFTTAFDKAQRGNVLSLIAMAAGLAALGAGVFAARQPVPPIPTFGGPLQRANVAFAEFVTTHLAPHWQAVAMFALALGAFGGIALAWGVASMQEQRKVADLKASLGKDLHAAVADLAHRLDLVHDAALRAHLAPRLERLQEQLKLPTRQR